jgi:carbonic anhydrase
MGGFEMSNTEQHDAGECSECSVDRRGLFSGALVGLTGLAVAAGAAAPAEAQSLTAEARAKLTPDDVIATMLAGNARFVSGTSRQRDVIAGVKATAGGQFPAAVVVSCVDSRAIVEVLCDLAIGDTFNARVAGNTVNDDILGSMEFACAAAGAKLVVVMGHTRCGAIAGAIDNVVLGNLTLLLARFQSSVAATAYTGDRSGKNYDFVDAVAVTNVKQTVEMIRRRSPVLADMEAKGSIKIVGTMYDIGTGKLTLV